MLLRLFPRRIKNRPAARSRAQRRTVRPRLNALEDRTLMSASASASLAANYGALPLAFEANVGQAAPGINYLAHGGDYNLALSSQQAVLSPANGAGDTLTFALAGANPQALAVSADQLVTRTNYLIGNDPSQWHTNIPNFGRVQYQNVYPGIDVTYYGNQGHLEYDFTVAPGADVGIIRLDVQGARGLAVDAAGNLVIHTSGSDLTEQVPVVYQVINGVRHSVAGQFVLVPSTGSGGSEVGFRLGAYDHSQTLVIDPVLSYTFTTSTLLFATAVDSAGEAYVTGGYAPPSWWAS